MALPEQHRRGGGLKAYTTQRPRAYTCLAPTYLLYLPTVPTYLPTYRHVAEESTRDTRGRRRVAPVSARLSVELDLEHALAWAWVAAASAPAPAAAGACRRRRRRRRRSRKIARAKDHMHSLACVWKVKTMYVHKRAGRPEVSNILTCIQCGTGTASRQLARHGTSCECFEERVRVVEQALAPHQPRCDQQLLLLPLLVSKLALDALLGTAPQTAARARQRTGRKRGKKEGNINTAGDKFVPMKGKARA